MICSNTNQNVWFIPTAESFVTAQKLCPAAWRVSCTFTEIMINFRVGLHHGSERTCNWLLLMGVMLFLRQHGEFMNIDCSIQIIKKSKQKFR